MKVTVHDVGHGLCISLIHDNGNVMLWDCGHNDDNRPSVLLPEQGVTRVRRFFVTNYDEDHISDLPNLRQSIAISSLHRNKSISGDQLRSLKQESGPLSDAMESMLDMISTYTRGPLEPPPEFPGVHFRVFYNPYGSTFLDTNNISLVTSLQARSCHMLIPGDLELSGWRALLEQNAFLTELGSVNVFVASHHGRESGYCEDVFKYCRPDVVVFSDSPVQYATQEMADTYAKHASGVPFNGEARYVLSTRKDGSISWTP